MPAWLRRQLVDTGHLTDDGLTRSARLRRCPRCRRPVLAGIDNNGLDAWADPAPLDADGEARALLDGRHTWDLFARTDLVFRTSMSIRHRPAGSDPDRPVLAMHACPEGDR